jgi:tRNA threonylcarbamoyladenosine biosynthesis protein TsaB
MIVLGFDTATPGTAVALRLADGSIHRDRHDPREGERPGHATRLLPMADRLLAQAGLDWKDIERIAVGLGPGTFTGLRVGVATARGLAHSLAVDLVGVGSLRALAHAAARDWPHGILAVIDARRGEAFVGAYAPSAELVSPRALAPERIGDLLPDHDGPWLAVGDGAVRYRPQLAALGVEVPADSSPLHLVDGACICELALDAAPSVPAALLPDYLRRPDAELALEGAQG